MLLKPSAQKFKYLLLLLTIFVVVFFVGKLALAQPDLGLNTLEDISLNGDINPYRLVVRVINILLSFLGLLAVIIVMYAGWIWMSSQGDATKIDNAKKMLINAAIGLLIILSAFGLVNWFLGTLSGILTGGSGGRTGGNTNMVPGLSSSSNGVIESHYPGRDQQNVPRNTSIVITFREAINPADIIIENNLINHANIFIHYKDGETNLTEVKATTTPDHKTFIFKPIVYLGSPSEDTEYTVVLSGAIKKENGQAVFPNSIGYQWNFGVSTIIDDTPPQVESAFPFPDTEESRNVIIEINFNEAINPLSVTNLVTNIDNIVVEKLPLASAPASSGPGALSEAETASEIVAGKFFISNQYRTVEFYSDDACGKNSCGETIYCLPALSNIKTTAKAAALNESFVGDFTTGIVDLADNSLDGDSDGAAEGSPDDDYAWQFATNNLIIDTAPKIIAIGPDISSSSVALNFTPYAIFKGFLSLSSINKDSVFLFPLPFPSAPEVAFYLQANNYISTPEENKERRCKINIRHSVFAENSGYFPQFNEKIKDIYQNCYTPSIGPGNTPASECTTTSDNPYCCDGEAKAAACHEETPD